MYVCRHLVGAGCLVVREVEGSVSWWFNIPGVGAFVKQLLKGRAAMIQLLKKTKYREMLQQEAEKRTLAGCRLPTVYIVYDIIGSDSVDWLVFIYSIYYSPCILKSLLHTLVM